MSSGSVEESTPTPSAGESATEPIEAGPATEPQARPSEGGPPPPKSRTRNVLILVGILVIVLAVMAVAIAVGGGGTPAKSSSRPSPSPGVGSPLGLAGTVATGSIGVTLTWSAPAGKAEILGYLVYRQGTQIASVPADTTTYTDTNVIPGEAYSYGVVTRGTGIQRSDRASAAVEVPVPALSTARLDGVFDVSLKTVSQSGYVGKLGKLDLGWSFRPNCHTGPCGVHWADVTSGSLRAILARRGKNYSGTDDGQFIGRCGSARLPSTLSIKIRVTKAEVVVGEWRAVRFVGKLKESHPSRLGCVSGGATFLITGTLAD
jgi:fibronectin type III domain protein